MKNFLKSLIWDYGEMIAMVALAFAIGLFVGWLVADFGGLL